MLVYLMVVATVVLGQTADLTHVDSYTDGLDYPGRLAPAAGGGIYVTDQQMGVVVEYDAAGLLVGTHAIAEGPVGIAVHPDGRIFVSRLDGVVAFYDAAFVYQGEVDATPFAMLAPNDIAIHPTTGEIYVTDSEAHQIFVFDPATGLLARTWGTEGSSLLEFQSPQAIAIDAALGRVIVTDVDNFRVQIFDTAGAVLTKFGYRTLYVGSDELAWVARAEGVAVDSCSNIYLADALMGTVRVFNSMGRELDAAHLPAAGYGTGPGELRIPIDVAIDAAGYLYVASANNAAVEVYEVTCDPGLAPPQGKSGNSDPLGKGGNIVPLGKDQKLNRLGKGKATPGASSAVFAPGIEMPDNPFDIVAAMDSGRYVAELDLNQDRRISQEDLEIAVEHFGGATVKDFLTDSGPRDAYEGPHMIDIDYLCGRCHSFDGAPGGMLSAEGQENLCVSCHTGSARAMAAPIGGMGNSNSHPLGVAGDAGDVVGPEAGSILALHTDGGAIRCGTCHNPHEGTAGEPYLRVSQENGILCKECHRGDLAPMEHGGEHHTEYCTDCHALHATDNGNLHLIPTQFDTYFYGPVDVTFTDDTVGVGPGAYVDLTPGVQGICETCHDNYPLDDTEIPVLHTDTMPPCTVCHAHHDGFTMELVVPDGEYVGADTCVACHSEEHMEWDETVHRDAWDNLAAAAAPPFFMPHEDPVCLECHTVGFGEVDGYVDQATTPHLDGVQCENCHGPGRAHVLDPLNVQPPIDKSSEMCGACHTGSHHPTYDEWTTSGHAVASAHAYYGSCDACHAPIGDDGGDPAVKFDVECVACHDSHAQTGNAAAPAEGRDYQLLYPEVVATTPSNTVEDATDPDRFNLCGQCHHSRGRTWEYDGRAPHHSVQGNTYVGEMPVPDGTPDLVPFTASDHAGLELQCVTCHMYTAPHEDGPPEVDAITGHSWHIDYEACAPCHGTAEAGEALATAIQDAVQARLDAIHAALGDPTTWEYIAWESEDGTQTGPPSAEDCAADPLCTWSQDDIADETKQVRFIYHYILGDGSLGVHNASYTLAMLEAAEALLGITAPEAGYVGADICAACHTEAHATWAETLHEAAWVNLEAIAAPPFFMPHEDPECLECHTVGLGETSGYVDQATTPHLAGVQCENCHGASGDHVLTPYMVQPVVDKASAMCGECHTGSHHPTYDEWTTSGHAAASAHAYYGSCDACHAPIGDDGGDPPVKFDVECVACHESHARTGHAAAPEEGRDYQLLYPEVVATTPSNTVEDATDPDRFNLCGQCHHSRGRTWEYDGRAPHHSVQGNTYVGEMPVPDGTPDLVPFTASDHAGLELQCVTCHMYTAPHEDGPPEVDAITGHSWHIDYEACAPCHGTAEAGEALATALQEAVQVRLDAIFAAQGDPTTWEYIAWESEDGTQTGPPSAEDCAADPDCTWSQDDIADDTKKVRFLYHYILGDGSLGVHNASYTLAMLEAAEALLGITAPAASYAGADLCAACHTEAHAEWEETLHEEAWVNLDAIFQGENPFCLPCHTVGFGEPGGYVDQATTPDLAGVQCENCHGASGDHVFNPYGTQPVIDKSADMCGTCHTGSHHPTYDEWTTSGHAVASAHAYYGSCDECHAPLGDDGGDPPVKFDVECVACHDSHAQTGLAEDPEAGRDYQLLYAEVVSPAPSSDVADATNPDRYNLCGHCHHSRGRTWEALERGPHHSQQANVYIGEMPVPDGTPDLVAHVASDHAGAALQCVTCHMFTAPHEEGPPEVDAITGHSWHVDTLSCNGIVAGCHASAGVAELLLAALQAEIQADLDDIHTRLGDEATWEYACCGGPPLAEDCDLDPLCTLSQDDISEEVLKIRFIYHYIEGDASLGAHNPDYVRALTAEADALLISQGL